MMVHLFLAVTLVFANTAWSYPFGISGGSGGICPAAYTDASGFLTVFPESLTAPTDVNKFAVTLIEPESQAAPTEALKAAVSGSGLSDSNAAPTDTKVGVVDLWLANSAGTSNVTNPANANGQNDGTSSSQQTAALGATVSSMTSTCSLNTTFTSALYRGWFNCTITLPTSNCQIIAHSTTGAYADIMMLNITASQNHNAGDFTFNLFAAGLNTAAKLNSTQMQHLTNDAAAGVTPAVLTVDAGRIELGGVF